MIDIREYFMACAKYLFQKKNLILWFHASEVRRDEKKWQMIPYNI